MPPSTTWTLIRKLSQNGRGLKIPIPRPQARAAGWQMGDYIAITLNRDDTITLHRVTLPEPRLATPPHPATQDRTA